MLTCECAALKDDIPLEAHFVLERALYGDLSQPVMWAGRRKLPSRPQCRGPWLGLHPCVELPSCPRICRCELPTAKDGLPSNTHATRPVPRPILEGCRFQLLSLSVITAP